MAMRDRRRSAVSLLVSLAFGPGFVAHEYAHALACRWCGVEVRAGPTLNPLGDAAFLEHAPVRRFRTDLTIATAPIVCNSALAIAAFAAAVAIGGTEAIAHVGGPNGAQFGLVLLGACFGMTAIPSPADTERLPETARELPTRMRPIGLSIAVAIRALTARSVTTGLTAFGWTVALYVAVTGSVPA